MPTLLEDIRTWFRTTDSGEDITLAPLAPDHLGSASPHAFVVDDEDGICQVIMMTLATMGVAAEKFHTARDAVAALDRRLPAIIFLDVALEKSDAIDVIRGLGERGYGGIVQLMSGSNVELLEDVRRIGARHGLNMRPPLSKPFRAAAIRHIVTSAHLAESTLTVVGLDEALAEGWLELWYQPKIDLAHEVARRRRGTDPLPASGPRHPVAGKLPARRDPKLPCDPDRARDNGRAARLG
jgi:CheY-like chemotaxis protein